MNKSRELEVYMYKLNELTKKGEKIEIEHQLLESNMFICLYEFNIL